MLDYWSKTGEMFKKIIEEPKMIKKYLKKPPLKYIYHIIIWIIMGRLWIF